MGIHLNIFFMFLYKLYFKLHYTTTSLIQQLYKKKIPKLRSQSMEACLRSLSSFIIAKKKQSEKSYIYIVAIIFGLDLGNVSLCRYI